MSECLEQVLSWIALWLRATYHLDVAILKTKQGSRKQLSEAELLDDATLRLMRAVKEKAAKSGKPLKKSELLKQGYSERYISKLEKA